MAALGVLCAVLAGALAVLAWRAPVPRRVAVRRLRRRGTDGLLLVAGSALATALVTGSLLIGDTLQASLVERATQRLGPVDVVVRSFAPVIADAVSTTLEFDPPPAADGVLDVTATDASIAAGDGTVVPGVRLLAVDPADATAPGGGDLRGAPTPPPGATVLTDDLAAALGVDAGASLQVYAYGRAQTVVVERVVPARGIAGFADSFTPRARNAFVAPELINTLAFDPEFPAGAQAPEALVLVSGRGDAQTGAAVTGELVAQLRERLATFAGFDVSAVKQDALDAAAEDAASYAELFTSLAAFAVLAGVALLANLFVMLGLERRAELGVLRAVGMRRSGLWASLVLEGVAYALAGGIAGSLGGVVVARLLVAAGGPVLSGVQRAGVDLRFAVLPGTLATGALVGVLVAVGVLSVTAVGIGRSAVGEAVRDLPAGARATRRGRLPFLLSAGATAALAAATVAAFAAGDDMGRVALPSLTVSGAALAVRTMPGRPPTPGRRRLVDTVAAVAVLVWSIAALGLLDVDDTDVGVFVVQGLALTLAGVVVLAEQVPRLGRAAAAVPGRLGIVLRLALTYPTARVGRTGATLATYSLVVYTLVFSSVLSSFFGSQVEQLVVDEGGGADLLVTTGDSAPVAPEVLTSTSGVAAVAPLTWTVAEFRVGRSGAYEPWALSGFDEALLALGPPRLESWDTGAYPDEAAVWRAVLADPGLAVADAAFLQRGGGPPQDNVSVGDTLQVRGPGTDQPTGLEVVALSAAGAAFTGVLAARAAVAAVDQQPVLNRHLVAVADGAEPPALAAELERTFVASGLEARTFREVVEDALADQSAFFDLIELYLALGLLVGIAGIGVVAARAVRERRREIAVLRTLGVDGATLRWALLAEAGLVAVLGSVLGGALALLGGYQLVTNTRVFAGATAGFSAPWLQLAALLATVAVTSVAVALPSARRAARATPAAGLRVDAPVG